MTFWYLLGMAVMYLGIGVMAGPAIVQATGHLDAALGAGGMLTLIGAVMYVRYILQRKTEEK